METEKTLRTNILDKIQKEEVVMRPRVFFVLQIVVLVLVSFLVLLCSVSVCSYILFTIRASGAPELMRHGPPGWYMFLTFFPWLLLMLDILLIALLEWMLRIFRFAYRSPVLYLLFGIGVVVVLASLLIDQSRTSDTFLLRAHNRHVPGLEGLYDRGHAPPPGQLPIPHPPRAVGQ